MASGYLYLLLQIVFVLGQRLSKNDVCTVEGKQSRCILVTDCATAAEAIKERKPPPICGFEGNTPIVCCPIRANSEPVTTASTTTRATPVTNRWTTPKPLPREPEGCGVKTFTIESNLSPAFRVARRKCHEYARAVFYEEEVSLLPGSRPDCLDSCPNEEPLVVGGLDAKPKQFPHMVLIGYGRNKINPEWLCGGTLISEKFVMSAAHCTTPSRRYGSARWVKLGELNLADDQEDARPVTTEIVNRFDHPQYKKDGAYYNDLALYELERPVNLNPYIRPACLPVLSRRDRTYAIASGWGRTAYGGPASDQLKYVKLNLVSNQECNNSYSSSIGKAIPRGILPESQICAGDEPGKDTCQGDSGGPLQLQISDPYCMFDIIGVTSFGKTCGMSSPGVYTNVQEFIPWIVEIVWPNELNQELRNS